MRTHLPSNRLGGYGCPKSWEGELDGAGDAPEMGHHNLTYGPNKVGPAEPRIYRGPEFGEAGAAGRKVISEKKEKKNNVSDGDTNDACLQILFFNKTNCVYKTFNFF